MSSRLLNREEINELLKAIWYVLEVCGGKDM